MGLHLFYTILQFLNVALSKALHCHYEHMDMDEGEVAMVHFIYIIGYTLQFTIFPVLMTIDKRQKKL